MARGAMLVLLTALASSSLGQTQGIRPTKPREIAATGMPMVAARPGDMLLARSKLGEITMEDLIAYYSVFRPPVRPLVDLAAVPAMPDPWIELVARVLASSQYAETKIEAMTDPKSKLKFQMEFETYLLNFALTEIIERRVTQRIVEPTDEEIQKYYEMHKPEYYRPLQFTMRHIMLSTYESYTVRPGDELEKIAEKISGDVKMTINIRSDVDTRPRRWVPPEERNKRLFKPLVIGERLLVPMNPEKAAEVRLRLEKILTELDQGVSFRDLAEQYSESRGKGSIVGPLPTGVRPIVAGLLEAGKTTPVGEVSSIFRTTHGYQVIRIENRNEEGYRSLEKVQAGIVETLRKNQEDLLNEELSIELFSAPELDIQFETLERAPNLPPSTVILRIQDREFLWEDFKRLWNEVLGEGATRDEVRSAMRAFRPAQLMLTLVWCEKNEVFAQPPLDRLYNALRTGVLGMLYTNQAVEAASRDQLTEELMHTYYEKNRDTKFAVPANVSYVTVERLMDVDVSTISIRDRRKRIRNLMKDLSRDLKKVRSIDDFVALAEESRANSSEFAGGAVTPLTGKHVDASLLSGATGDRVRRLKAGKWSKPFIDINAVRATALIERSEATWRPFDDVKPEIEQELLQQLQSRVRREFEDEALEEIDFEFLLTSN